eukprot:TCALIF_09023-PA protein Name:"Similar to MRPL46 39S ribosomal protein L46, mitochondrial (Bos taurus)" AED:0.13 eAED:0.13 QI:0/0.5/0/0.66/0.5/0.66/3/0/251
MAQTAKSSATPTPAELWDIAVSVCVERHPRVTPPLAELPKTFLTCLRQQEIEQSLLNDHELAIQREARAKSAVDASLQKREAGLKTTLDLEDDWQKEMAQFPLPPRDPEARGTPHEPAPTLTRPVVLMVRHLRGATPVWTLPMAQRLAGETLRQTAERAVLDNVGSRLQVQILGLAPWAVYNNRYSKTMQGHCGKMGSKMFIYKAHYLEGQVEIQNEAIEDYQWALREELQGHLLSDERNALANILYDEEP